MLLVTAREIYSLPPLWNQLPAGLLSHTFSLFCYPKLLVHLSTRTQVSPPPYSPEVINYNFFSEDYIKEMFHTVLVARESVMSAVQSSRDSTDGSVTTTNTNMLLENHLKHEQPATTAPTAKDDQNLMHPHSILAQPIFNRLKDESSSVSALLLAVIPWDRYVVGLLPEHVKGIYVVLRNSCNQSYTYKLDGSAVRHIYPSMVGRVVVFACALYEEIE
jgi:hypothetical protein